MNKEGKSMDENKSENTQTDTTTNTKQDKSKNIYRDEQHEPHQFRYRSKLTAGYLY